MSTSKRRTNVAGTARRTASAPPSAELTAALAMRDQRAATTVFLIAVAAVLAAAGLEPVALAVAAVAIGPALGTLGALLSVRRLEHDLALAGG